jgi:hypothetical protein
MKKINFIVLSIFSILIISTTSCDFFKKKDKEIDFVVIDTLEADSILKKHEKGLTTLSKGPVWQTWKKLHKACIKNEFFKNPTYLGLSNTVDLGSLYSKSGEMLEWDFNKLFTESDRKKVINSGQPQPCEFTEQLKVDLQAFIATELPSTGIDGELAVAIKNQKDISVKIDNWQIDNIINGELRFLLNSSSDPKVVQFKKDLLEKELIMVSQVARINGFSSIINLNTDISASLEAKLKEGIVKNIGNTEAKVKFEYSSTRQIKVTSQGSFIVFVEFVKAIKVVV